MKPFLLGLLTASSLLLTQVGTSNQLAPGGATTIIVDPDVRISYEGNLPHMEAYIAASASLADVLIAGGDLLVPGRGDETRLYFSSDAGARWSPVLLSDEVNGGWDNAVAAGPDGAMYFLTGNFRQGLVLYRTNDNGKTWSRTPLADTLRGDRPHMIVDNTTTATRGRVYIAAEMRAGLGVVSSSDGGQTFGTAVVACPRRPGWNPSTTASPMVLSDGMLLVPCLEYPDFPARNDWSSAEIGLVESRDGGRTFSPYRPTVTVGRGMPRNYWPARARGDVFGALNYFQGPSFASAPAGTPFGDRLYAAWQDVDAGGRSELFFSWSADRGVTWSSPAAVDASQAGGRARQAVPMLAVNREGVIGVAWFDGRMDREGKSYDVYFTASVDGGRTFLPSARVSTATSRPTTGLNVLATARVGDSTPNGERVIAMGSPFNRRAAGGDYSTMAVDAAGRFHPLWTDARSGTWQLYTSTIRIVPEQTMQRLASDRTRRCVVDSSQIQLVFGESQWNAATNEMSMPVRLVNTSAATFVEPLSVKVSVVPLQERMRAYFPNAVEVLPKLVHPANGTLTDLVSFTYPVSPRAPLFPGGSSVSVDWQVRLPSSAWIESSLSATVTGTGC